MEEGSSDVVKEGYVDLKMNKTSKVKASGWRARWLCLCGGSLFYYKNELDVKPCGVLQIGGDSSTTLDVVEYDAKDKETKDHKECKFFIRITIDGKPTCMLAAKKAEKRDAWFDALKQAATMDQKEAPPKDYIPLQKKTLAFRAKKTIGSKVAGSTLGKQSMESIVMNEEVRGLLQAFRELIKAQSDKQTADWVEKAIIKIVVKVYLEWNRKTITTNDLLKMDKPLREGFNLLDRIYRHSSKKKAAQLKDTFERAEKCFQEVISMLIDLLKPLIRPKNIMMLREVGEYVATAKFMMTVWDLNLADTTGHMDECFFNLCNAMSKYTQVELSTD